MNIVFHASLWEADPMAFGWRPGLGCRVVSFDKKLDLVLSHS